jgi:hypothetical protein
MRFQLRFGKSGKRGHLTPGQQAVLDRLENGEITVEEAARALGGNAHISEFSVGGEPQEKRDPQPSTAAASSPATAPAELTEDEKAREMIDRIARELDAETNR